MLNCERSQVHVITPCAHAQQGVKQSLYIYDKDRYVVAVVKDGTPRREYLDYVRRFC